MLGETLNAAPPSARPPGERLLPKRLLYSIFARIGDTGLGTEAYEKVLAAYRGGFLGKVVGYGDKQTRFRPRSCNRSGFTRCG
jgi:hypothetical protein